MKTLGAFGGIVGDMEHNQLGDSSQQDQIGAHPIVATVHEVARLRRLGNEVAGPATPTLPTAVLIVFIAPLAVALVSLALVIAQLG